MHGTRAAEDRANTLTHAGGIVASAAGGAALIVWAALRGDAWKIVGVSIFVATLLLLYSASTAYHAVRSPELKARLKVLDHGAIYLLIAGTYTPLTLTILRGAVGWTLFAIVWTLAAAGITKDAVSPGRHRWLSMVLYVAMGWLVIFAFGPLKNVLPSPGLVLLIVGGIIYTAGLAFYALSKKVAHMHGVWHLCVLGGSVCHYFAVLRYVAMAPM